MKNLFPCADCGFYISVNSVYLSIKRNQNLVHLCLGCYEDSLTKTEQANAK
jgi:hypothetical protein